MWFILCLCLSYMSYPVCSIFVSQPDYRCTVYIQYHKQCHDCLKTLKYALVRIRIKYVQNLKNNNKNKQTNKKPQKRQTQTTTNKSPEYPSDCIRYPMKTVGGKSNFTLVNHWWRSTLRQFAQEQSTNMTSQQRFLALAWRHRSTVVTSQCWVSKDRP